MLSTILSFLSGGIIGQIGKQLNEALRTRLEAQNDADRIAADKEIAFWQEQMALARTAAEHDKWYSPRSMIAYGCALYVLKIVVWDTTLGLGVTPDPGTQVNAIVMLVLGFYFGSKAVVEIAGKMFGRR